MSRLLKLKEWLTLEEAANHISNVIGEPVVVADLYRFCLDGHIRLSVHFVNKAKARPGQRIAREDVEFDVFHSDLFTGLPMETPVLLPTHNEIALGENSWARLDDRVVAIDGIWDLSMVGAEILDIEHFYQGLTSGLEVSLINIDGTYVERAGTLCQLLESYDNNEYQAGSMARKKELDEYIEKSKISKKVANELITQHEKEREEFLKSNQVKKEVDKYFPAGGLPQDCVIVARTSEVTRFIRSLEDEEKIGDEKNLTSKERNSLLVLIGALCKEVGIDTSQRGVATAVVKMTENIGAPLSDDTVRKILGQVDDAVERRQH